MKRIGLSSKSPLLASALVLAGALLASGGDASAKLTETDVLASFAAKGVRPSLAGVADTAQRLSESSRQLCEKRDAASLAGAQDAWKKAYMAWRRSAPFQFGPAGRLGRQLGKPVHGAVLDAAVSDSGLRLQRKNPDLRGYAAVEHLLFVPGNAAAATAADRCEHLRDVTGEIVDLTARAKREWDQGFGNEFVAAGDGKPFLVPGDALSLALASALNTTETVLRDGIGFPSGFFKEAAKPDLLAAWRSNSSRDAFQWTLDGLRLALLGDGSTGIMELVATKDGLVSRKDPALAADIRRQIEKLGRTIADLGGSDLVLHAELKKNPAKLKSLYKEMQKLQDQLVQATLVLELDVRSAAERQ